MPNYRTDSDIFNSWASLGSIQKYLLVGGMPDALNEFLESQNIVKIRDIQNAIHELYELDAGKYDEEHRLKIKRIYEMIPSNMENKKKRLFFMLLKGKRQELQIS